MCDFVFFSVAGLLRPVRVRRKGDVGHLGAAVDDRLLDDHSRELAADREDAPHQ